jgi:hypothetical protein
MCAELIANERKRKSTEVTQTFEEWKALKARRVSDGIHAYAIMSTDASASITGTISGEGCDAGDQENLQREEYASNTAGREERIGKLVQDLFHYGHPAIVRAALDALCAHLKGESKKCDFVTVGGCAALVQLLKICVRTVTKDARAQLLSAEVVLGDLSQLKTLYARRSTLSPSW